jgi:hypothetical protein
MSNDLATEITERVERLLNVLLTTLVWRRLPTVPPLGHRLYTRYSNWAGRLFSRIYSPLTSALLLSRSSNPWLLPLSYAWFDKRWIDRKKEPRSFWNQSDDRMDESIQRLSVPEYFFEEDAEEGLIKQFQSSQFEPADDIIRIIPTLMTLSVGNTESARPERLAKQIAPKLELLTNKGSPAPWHMPYDADDVPYYLGLVANNRLLDKGKEITTSQHSSHLEKISYPSSPADLSSLILHSVSGQYIGTTLMPVPRNFLLAERTPTEPVFPFISPLEDTNSHFEPSGALPAALNSEPESEVHIASLSYLPEFPLMPSNNTPTGKALSAFLSYLSESPSVIPNKVPAGKLLPQPRSPFETPFMASSTNLMGKMLADSRSYLSEPPQAASDAVLAEKADTTPNSYPELASLFDPDETLDMTSTAYRYLEMTAPQPPLDKIWGSRQTSSFHLPAGYTPPSLTEEAVNQEMGEPVKSITSTIKNSSFGGYNRSVEVGLALAPIGRTRENIPAATSNTANGGQERALEPGGETMPTPDPEALALEVYSILKRRLIVEKERTTSVVA